MANILIAPSDHIILGEKKFEAIVENAFKFVDRQQALVTIGSKAHKAFHRLWLYTICRR
jgi:mannose-1-phosphate guanylyltransferase